MKSSHRAARPVFLDRSGLRRRRVVMVGAAVATTLITGLVVLVVGFFGSSAGHVPSFPGADAPAGTSSPHRSADMSTAPSGAQSPRSASTTGTTPAPGASSVASASPTSKRRYPSHQPRPTKSR